MKARATASSICTRTDVEAIAAAPLDEMLAGAVIAGRRVAAAVVRAQTAAAMPAAGEALQECAAFPHGAACLVRPGSRVLRDALLVGLIGLPVDVASMMLFDQHLPLIARQMPDALAPQRLKARASSPFASCHRRRRPHRRGCSETWWTAW